MFTGCIAKVKNSTWKLHYKLKRQSLKVHNVPEDFRSLKWKLILIFIPNSDNDQKWVMTRKQKKFCSYSLLTKKFIMISIRLDLVLLEFISLTVRMLYNSLYITASFVCVHDTWLIMLPVVYTQCTMSFQ